MTEEPTPRGRTSGGSPPGHGTQAKQLPGARGVAAILTLGTLQLSECGGWDSNPHTLSDKAF
jgi:hypothetical protein